MEQLERLLDLAVIESGDRELELEETDLCELAAECIEHSRDAALAKDIPLSLDAPERETVWVQADATGLRQVFNNLVSNALKYTHPGGKVWVSCGREDGNAVVHVRDTGQGLGPDDLAQAFRSFRRLSARPTAGEPSNGLGLAIAKGIIDVHGGRIWVKSQKGKGSTFSFSLPLVDEVAHHRKVANGTVEDLPSGDTP
jgi:signal transduction histidine kinase